MKKQLLINPLTLKGNEILERQKQLMGISSINENKSNSAVELTKIGPDGNAYAVIRENHEWYIKKANKVNGLILEDFKYIGGLQNKKQEVYPSYAKAIKHLNLKFKSLAEAYNYDGEINVFENDNLLNENVNMDEAKKGKTKEAGRKFVGKEIGHLEKDKGYSHDRAVAASLNIAREKCYPVEEEVEEEADNYSDNLIDYVVPEWAMSALINGDYSGLSDEDEEALTQFVNYVEKQHGNANFMVGDIDGEDDLGFQHDNDVDNYSGNVYRVYIRPDEEVEMTEYEKAIDEMIAKEELHGGQKLDVNKNGKIDADDFKMLRASKGLKKKA